MSDLFDDLTFHFCTMMLIAFKLTNFIGWSWWLVCSPTIIALLLYFYAKFSGD